MLEQSSREGRAAELRADETTSPGDAAPDQPSREGRTAELRADETDPPYEDDGHTIADMSMIVGGPEPTPGLGRSFADELQDGEERRAVLLGALKAGLGIGLVYIVIFGIAIALMVWLWS